jgi:hypothetical protein
LNAIRRLGTTRWRVEAREGDGDSARWHHDNVDETGAAAGDELSWRSGAAREG